MGLKPITTKSTTHPPQDCDKVSVLMIHSEEYGRMFCRVFTTYGSLFDHLHQRIRAIDPSIPERDQLKHKVDDYERFMQRVRNGQIISKEYLHLRQYPGVSIMTCPQRWNRDLQELEMRCGRCRQWWPLTSEFFRVCKGTLRSPCIACIEQQKLRTNSIKRCCVPHCNQPRAKTRDGRARYHRCVKHQQELSRRNKL